MLSDRLQRYNVVWSSPSRDASGSMPLGNGDIGLNVWVEEDGDLLLLIGKTDAWDENSINLKLGRIRIKLSPNPFASGAPFRQTLDLPHGDIKISASGAGAEVRLQIWVDANRPVIHLDVDSDVETALVADLEMWRTSPRTIKTQTSDLFRNLQGKDPHPTIISPDRVLPQEKNRIVWCHHNEQRQFDGYEINMRLQGLGDLLEVMQHPLVGRTFGAAIEGEGLISSGERTLTSARPGRRWRLSIHALTVHPASVESWREKLDAIIEQDNATEPALARREHERWWQEFWQRSWIYVTSPLSEEAERAFHITQSYILQRFMNAAAGRGPIKHNGSLFSVGNADDPDFRRWGGPGFWFQNQRLIYWPMLAAGDFDLLRPWFGMYRDMLPLQQHRTQTYFHHGGAHYPETVTFWGAEVSAHYEWTPFEQRSSPEAQCAYVRYYWTGGLELALMLVEHFARSLDEDFARQTLIPIANAVTEFFDLHYPRDSTGKIHFAPSQSLETWHQAVNPLPDIAGLRYLLPRLLALPEPLTPRHMRDRWTRMLSELPPIPLGEKDGKRVILPAEHFAVKKNTENPELYCVFPFRLFGVGKPDLQLARDTFAARLHKSHDCWSQDEIQMAHLGLADEAADFLSKRASRASHSESRFPAFWDAFHDWVPDIDHGGVLQRALQSMLMQTEGSQILLLPAWPKEWDVDFKLHAPQRTTVEAKVRGGRIAELKVTPEDRRTDVRMIER